MFNKLNIHNAFFWSSLLFLVGVGLAVLFGAKNYFLILFLFLLSFYLFLIKKSVLAWLVLSIITGIFYFQIFSYFQLKAVNIPFNENIQFEGLVKEVKNDVTQQLKVSLLESYSGNINIKAPRYPEFNYGDRIIFIGTIQEYEDKYKKYYLSKGVFGESNFPKLELVCKNKGNFIKEKLFSFKEKIQNIFKSVLPKEKAAFLSGITIGGRDDFSKEFKDKMSLSGTTHLVALSGYNISIIILAVGTIFSSIFSAAISFYFSIFIVILFVIMAGAEASVVRAAIMGIIVIFSAQTERLFNPRNAIVVAAVVMTLFNPGILIFDIGFQLSFAALLGIIYLAPALKNLLKTDSGGFLSWKENAINTAAAQIMALPILLSSFGVFSFSSLLANILILEFIPITMGIGFMIIFFGLFSNLLAKVLAIFVNIFISYEFFIINIFSKLSIPFKIEEAGLYIWVFYYLVIFIFIKFYKENEKGI